MSHLTRLPSEPRTLDEPLAYWAERNPGGEAVTYGSRSWTWADWNQRVRRAAGGLRDLGVGRGDVVAFLDKNHPSCVEITLAAGSLGAAHAIISWRSSGDEIAHAVNDSGARVLFAGTELLSTIEPIVERLGGLERIVTVTADGAPGDQYEAWLAGSSPLDGPVVAEPDDVCLVLYSSGTTGRPKGVMLTHRAMVRHTDNAHEGWGFEEGDKSLVAMPLSHVGGSSYILFSIFDGVPSVMTREPDGGSLAWGVLQGANRTFLVPSVLAQVLQSGDDAIRLFGALRTCTYGAAPMPAPLLQASMLAWPETDFIQVYGLTEVGGVITHLLPEAHRAAAGGDRPERLLSAGTLLPEAECRVVDAETLVDVPPGQPGELWFRTPQMMAGYLGQPEATAQVVTDDGWLRSGDVGRMDGGGYVYIEDRLTDLIISGSENIYSSEVERVLAEHPAVADVAVIGVPDDRWGEVVKAVVTLKAGTTATEDGLIAFCGGRLAKLKCPASVDVVPALPRNATGKIVKKDLRAPHWDGRDRAVV